MAITQKIRRLSLQMHVWRVKFFSARSRTPPACAGRLAEVEDGKNLTSRAIGVGLLLFSIVFNLWIYRLEPTAKTDPNDNTFQYALVDRTNQIWEYAQEKCAGFFLSRITCHASLLADHWVPNWAEGYNLPYYYSHIPQIAIVASYRLINFIRGPLAVLQGVPLRNAFSLFQYYHIIIYLLLCLFPLSIFMALRIIGLSWLSAGLGALIATQLSTDGLYGLDPASFVWRGYGLSSQLFAMIWLPLAIAFAYRGRVLPAILTLAATTAGHLGVGIIAFLSTGVIFLRQLGHVSNVGNLKKLLLIFGGVFLLLGYWIVPILIHGNYHNISVWDGIWKFDSFGYREVLKNLINGDLFDFGRFPILTLLVFIGLFSSLVTLPRRQAGRYPASPAGRSSLALLLPFWLLMYFGRTTWGGLFTLIPGMSEFHLSRFIVGVHIAGLFLIPIGLESLVSRLPAGKAGITHHASRISVTLLLCFFVSLSVFPQTLRYAAHNDYLIKRANTDYLRDEKDVQLLISRLSSLITQNPGRVFAGRGGSWGKNFRIAETPMYMYLSTFGIPVVLWLPETWSPNSDTEQYFSENNPDHYTLYNVRYVATPINLPKEQIQPFWRLLETEKAWKIYEVETGGYITTGIRPAIVSSGKEDYRSVVRLWMHSAYPEQRLYPELTFDKNYPKNSGLPNFRMLDEVTFVVPSGTRHNLFSEVPSYVSPLAKPDLAPRDLLPIVTSQSSDNDMVFSGSVEVPPGCTECVVILRQTFHPSWKATVDGKPVDTMTVFPFYTAVKLNNPGTHTAVFFYEPSLFKKLLLCLALLSLGGLLWLASRKRPH